MVFTSSPAISTVFPLESPGVCRRGWVCVVTPPTEFDSEIMSCGKKLVDDALTIFVVAFATREAAAFNPETAMLKMPDIAFLLYWRAFSRILLLVMNQTLTQFD